MNYSFVRGDTFVYPKAIAFTDSNGNILTLSNEDKVYMTVKQNARAKKIIIQKTIGNGIEIEDNYCYITIEPEDTADLPYGTYGYDISIKLSNGIVATPIVGQFTLTDEYTHEEDEV